jgi:DNA-binding transcriptional LysR family regulator
MMTPMELRQLRYFVAVAEELNFTKAAQKLRVAQPALSRQIRQLEEEMGVELFERGRTGARLTKGGRAFLPEARAVLNQTAKAVRAAQTSSEAEALTLNVGYAWGLFHSLVPTAISRFHDGHRDVAINLFDMTAPQQSAALLEGRLDAGFIGFARDADAPGLARRQIGPCTFLLALPSAHWAARKRTVDLCTLAKEFFCVISDQNFPGCAACALEACAEAGFRPRVLQTAARGNTMLGLVSGNRAVGLVPAPLADLPHPGVIFKPLSRPYQSELYVVWDGHRTAPVRDAFLDAAAASVSGSRNASLEGLQTRSRPSEKQIVQS